jgi:RNA polymerase sigma-70 factor (ECF subfamily)
MNSTREETFLNLLDANRKRLMAIARSYARGEETRDLHQEILLQLWRSLDRFGGRSSIDTWIYHVALNTAILWRRRAAPDQRNVDRSLEPGEQSGSVGPRDELAILDEFILSLNRADRAVFVLYLEDLPYRQIAEVTGLTEGHVGVKLHRLKKAFVERYL